MAAAMAAAAPPRRARSHAGFAFAAIRVGGEGGSDAAEKTTIIARK